MRKFLILTLLSLVFISSAYSDPGSVVYPKEAMFVSFTNPLTGTAGLTADQVIIHNDLTNFSFWNKIYFTLNAPGISLVNPLTITWEFTNSTSGKCQGSATPAEAMGPVLPGQTHFPTNIDISACSAKTGYYFTNLSATLRTNNRGFYLLDWATFPPLSNLLIGATPNVTITLQAGPRIMGTVIRDSGRCGPVIGKYVTCDLKRFGTFADCVGNDKSIKTVARLDSAKVFENNYSDNSKFLNESSIDVTNDKFCLNLGISNLRHEGEACSDFTECDAGLCCAYSPTAQISEHGYCAKPMLVEGAPTTQFQKDANGITFADVPGHTGWTCGRATAAACNPSAGSSIQCGSKCCGSKTLTCCELNSINPDIAANAYCKADSTSTCV